MASSKRIRPPLFLNPKPNLPHHPLPLDQLMAPPHSLHRQLHPLRQMRPDLPRVNIPCQLLQHAVVVVQGDVPVGLGAEPAPDVGERFGHELRAIHARFALDDGADFAERGGNVAARAEMLVGGMGDEDVSGRVVSRFWGFGCERVGSDLIGTSILRSSTCCFKSPRWLITCVAPIFFVNSTVSGRDAVVITTGSSSTHRAI